MIGNTRPPVEKHYSPISAFARYIRELISPLIVSPWQHLRFLPKQLMTAPQYTQPLLHLETCGGALDRDNSSIKTKGLIRIRARGYFHSTP